MEHLKTLWLANNKIKGFSYDEVLIIELGPRCSDILLQRDDAKEVFFVCMVMKFNDREIQFSVLLFVSKKRTELFYDLTKVYYSYSISIIGYI